MKHYDLELLLRRKVTEEARQYVVRGGRMNQVATRAGIAFSTVSKLVYGETIHPRFHTVVAVLDALGFTLELTHKIHTKAEPLPHNVTVLGKGKK